MKQSDRLTKIIYKQISDLEQLIDLFPQKKERFHIITKKQIHALSIIQAIVNNRKINEIYLTSYRINEHAVDEIVKLVKNNQIEKGSIIVSSFFLNDGKRDLEPFVKKLIDFGNKNKNIKVKFIHNHSKICAIKTGADYLVFEGSGNLSNSAYTEQYFYTNNKELFQFHKNWISEIT